MTAEMNLTLSFTHTTATLVFDRKDCPGNFLDSAMLAELSRLLDELTAQPEISGLLILSSKPDTFTSGADLDELSAARGERLSGLITAGQELFNRIADLPYPTVAAIHGACIGGGYELALACDWRVASDAPETKIALPEAQLGILPAWGGTTRLPDLLGLQEALPVILSGKIHSATLAKAKGLIDELVPKEHLESHALDLLKRGKRHRTHNPIIHNQAIAALTRVQAQKDLQKKTRGHYPSLEAALEVAVASIGRTRAQSQQAEREAIFRLVPLPQTAHLIRQFSLRERACKRRYTAAESREIRHAAVLGAGGIGSGIAYSLSAQKIHTILHEPSLDTLASGMKTISSFYEDAQKLHLFSKIEAARGIDHIYPAAGAIPLHRSDFIIETAAEDLSVREKTFTDLASRCRPDAILAVHAFAQPISSMSACIEHPERFIGLHFPHPTDQTELVEMIRAASTSDETLATALALVRRLGKLPVVVRDSPGFLINRILMPYLVKAVSLFEEGCDPEEIDAAMLDFGMVMGPLRFLDEIGLDTALDIARVLAAAFPERMAVPEVVEKLLEAGHTGRKGGSGFYVYDHASPPVNAEAIGFQTGTEDTPADVQEVLSGLIMHEAQLCLEEGVAESADDIDLAVILGTGYPAFRGGPLSLISSSLKSVS